MAFQKEMQELSTDECLRLLGNHALGRLAFMDQVGDLPLIVPVNYVLHQNRVVFRTGVNSQLGTALHQQPVGVAFEVDGIDAMARVGWSVLVRGYAKLLQDSFELAALWDTPVQPWAPGAKPYFVRIQPSQVSGRRIRDTEAPPDWCG